MCSVFGKRPQKLRRPRDGGSRSRWGCARVVRMQERALVCTGAGRIGIRAG